jgi:hypothetical protein
MFGKIDTVDAVAGGIFTLASMAKTGVYTGGKLQPGNIALSDAVWSSGGTVIDIAFVVSLGVLLVAYGTNRLDDGKKGPDVSVNTDLNDIFTGKASYETYIAGGTLVIVLLTGFNILGFTDLVQSHWIAGYTVTGLQMGGYYVFSWMG